MITGCLSWHVHLTEGGRGSQGDIAIHPSRPPPSSQSTTKSTMTEPKTMMCDAHEPPCVPGHCKATKTASTGKKSTPSKGEERIR